MKQFFLSNLCRVAGVFLVTACDGSHVDAGHDEPPEGVVWPYEVSHSFGACPPDTTPDERTGTWRGELDDYVLRSGSRSIRIVIEGRSKQGNCGSVTLGDAGSPPVPTDPEAWYAPGLAESQWLPYSESARSIEVEGFPYEFGRGPGASTRSDLPPTRARLELVLYQPYKAWCNLQPSYSITTNVNARWPYSCLPDHDSATRSERFDDEGREVPAECAIDGAPVACTQMDLCGDPPICDCRPEGCTVDSFSDGRPYTSVMLTFDGDAATGSIALADGIASFHLTRD